MKRGLQIALGVLALIPGFFAVSGLIGGAGSYAGDAVPAALDNQLRYLSGVYLIIPLLVVRIIGRIEEEGTTLSLIVSVLFIGALGRLYSTVAIGAPPPQQLVGMGLELGSPLLLIWQRFVAQHAKKL
ncbi:MAG: DUF4345 domain-containing protein [Pseudomonadota bacterium]